MAKAQGTTQYKYGYNNDSLYSRQTNQQRQTDQQQFSLLRRKRKKSYSLGIKTLIILISLFLSALLVSFVMSSSAQGKYGLNSEASRFLKISKNQFNQKQSNGQKRHHLSHKNQQQLDVEQDDGDQDQDQEQEQDQEQQQQHDKPFTEYKAYNLKNKGQKLGKSSKFAINLTNNNFVSPIPRLNMSQLGLDTRIQVGSLLDFGLNQKIDFDKLDRDLSNSIAHEVYQYKYNRKLQRKQQRLKMKEFKNDKQRTQYLNNLKSQEIAKAASHPDDLQYNLGLKLILQPDNKQLLQAEYFHMDSKYSISQISQKNQLPICILTMQRNIATKQQYTQYFKSVEALNYSNFHIVYIDDNSQDNSSSQIHSYLDKTNSRLKNRIKIIRNLQDVGALGNLYLWTKKYCHQHDVVIVVDGDDAIIGRQVLKVISSVYQSKSVWYAYASYTIMSVADHSIFKGQQSVYLPYPTSQYRASFQWLTSHLRTFRKQLMDSVPIYSLIEYLYDNSTGLAYPAFYQSAADLFQTFAQMELAGNFRVVHLDQYFYNYYGSARNTRACYRQKQIYSDFLSRIKTPLKILRKLGDKGQMTLDYNLSKVDFLRIKEGYQNLQQCLKNTT